jgi:hypothetical protein
MGTMVTLVKWLLALLVAGALGAYLLPASS